MSLYFALPGALAYGLADFAGGMATRRAPVFVVTAVVQVAGLVALLPVMPFAGGTLSWAAVGWGVLAAAGGTGGLLLYLRALAAGRSTGTSAFRSANLTRQDIEMDATSVHQSCR